MYTPPLSSSSHLLPNTFSPHAFVPERHLVSITHTILSTICPSEIGTSRGESPKPSKLLVELSSDHRRNAGHAM